jgi:hypothetical protein
VSAATPGQAAHRRWHQVRFPESANGFFAAEWQALGDRAKAAWEAVAIESGAPELAALRDLLDEIGVMAANAPEYGNSFGVLEEIAMRIAAAGGGIVIDIAPAPGALLNGIPLDDYPDASAAPAHASPESDAGAKLTAIRTHCERKAAEFSADMFAVHPQDIRVNAGDILAIIDGVAL